jgi:DNA-binding beta-propeller fold protein YncE
VQVIDTATDTLRRTVTLTGTPYGVAISPDGSQAWITAINPAELWHITLP